MVKQTLRMIFSQKLIMACLWILIVCFMQAEDVLASKILSGKCSVNVLKVKSCLLEPNYVTKCSVNMLE